MRRRTLMRWIEEAEARKMRLYDAEFKPAVTATAAAPEFLLATRATLTVLVARMTGRVERADRDEPPAGDDTSADGSVYEVRKWPVVGCGGTVYPIAAGYAASARRTAYASAYSRKTSLTA